MQTHLEASVSAILNHGRNLTLSSKITSMTTDRFIVLELSTVRGRLFSTRSAPSPRGEGPLLSRVQFQTCLLCCTMGELSQTRLWQMLAACKSSLHKLARLPCTFKFNSLSVFHTHGCLDRRRRKDKKDPQP